MALLAVHESRPNLSGRIVNIWQRDAQQAVVIEAQHGCMTGRGVKTPGVGMVTSRMMGTFLSDPRSRKEVLSLMGY